MTDFDEKGGWAANANLNVALSDLGTVNVSGRMETAGFGASSSSRECYNHVCGRFRDLRHKHRKEKEGNL